MKKVDGSTKLRRSGQGKLRTPKISIPDTVKTTKRKKHTSDPTSSGPSAPNEKDLSGNEREEDNNVAEEVTDAVCSAISAGVSTIADAVSDRPQLLKTGNMGQKKCAANNVSRQAKEAERTAKKARADPGSGRTGNYEEQGAERETEHQTSCTKYGTRLREYNKSKEGYSGKLHSGKSAKENLKIKHGHSELSEGSNAASRQLQKRNMQKQMMQRGRNQTPNSVSGVFQSFGQKMENVAQKMGESALKFVKNNPLLLLIAGAVFVVILAISGAASAFGLMLSGGSDDLVLTSSFTAEDSEILRVEENYCTMERELQTELDRTQTDYPGYDEYCFSMSAITHDPVELAAYLTVLYEDYTEAQAFYTLYDLMEGQYDLFMDESTETRTRTETRWRNVTKYRDEQRTGFRIEHGRIVRYTYTVQVEYQELESYEVEVEYEWKVLSVTLTGQTIDAYVRNAGLTDEQLMRYELLKETKGNKPELFEQP